MRVHFTKKSSNKKVGKLTVTTTEQKSCPDTCPLKDAGCYADGGPLAILWKKVSSYDEAWDNFCTRIEQEATEHWRHNQAGDLPHKKGKLDKVKVEKLVHASRKKKGMTYTHHDVVNDVSNREIVGQANLDGFTINLSGNNLNHADTLADLSIAPVTTLLPIKYERKSENKQWTETLAEYKQRIDIKNITTQSGRKVTVCPATYLDDMDCKKCLLCWKQRETIVGFPAHGFRKKKAEGIAT